MDREAQPLRSLRSEPLDKHIKGEHRLRKVTIRDGEAAEHQTQRTTDLSLPLQAQLTLLVELEERENSICSKLKKLTQLILQPISSSRSRHDPERRALLEAIESQTLRHGRILDVRRVESSLPELGASHRPAPS